MPPGRGALSTSVGCADSGSTGANHERALAEAFVEAGALVVDFGVIDFLHTPAEQLHATAASSAGARLLELFELQSDAGPCVDCFTTGAR